MQDYHRVSDSDIFDNNVHFFWLKTLIERYNMYSEVNVILG